MQELATTQQAVEFWAAKAAHFDGLLTDLDKTLPAVHRGEVPFTADTREDVEAALQQARLAADTVLGAYTRVLHQERATPNTQVAPYSQQYGKPRNY